MATPKLKLARWVPALYNRRDDTGDWARVLSVLEGILNGLLSSQDTRAALDCGKLGAGKFDTVLEAVSEGDDGREIHVALEVVPGAALAVSSPATSQVVLGIPLVGGTTVGAIEDAIGALDEASRLVRVRTPGTRARALGTFDGFAATSLTGASPAGRVLGKISIDAMTDLRDPLRAELRLLPYLAQHYGWNLDTSLPERLQRKVLTLAEALFQEKGTRAGIVDALRLLLGIEVVYEEAWADGWTLDKSRLGLDTMVAPAPTVAAHAEGSLVAVAPGTLVDHDDLASPGLAGGPYEIQVAATASAEKARGYLNCRDPGLLSSGMTLVLYGTTFEFSRTLWTIGVGHVGIDLTGVTPASLAAQISAAILVRHTFFGLPATSQVGGFGDHLVRIESTTTGTGGNGAITGAAAEVLDAVGMVGGAGAGAFAPTGGHAPLRLSGAADTTAVARLLAYEIGWNEPAIDVTRALSKLYLRQSVVGAGGNGAFSGSAATKLSASGMAGGVGLNPDVLSFRLTFPRHLTDQELRTAIAVVDAMKKTETHWTYTNPPAVVLPLWRLDKTPLDRSRLAGGGGLSFIPQTGHYVDDPHGAKSLESYLVPLGAGSSTRSPVLPVGASFIVQADDDCHIRQGNRVVAASTSDRFLAAGVEQKITIGTTAEAYVAALRRSPTNPSPAYLRLIRTDG